MRRRHEIGGLDSGALVVRPTRSRCTSRAPSLGRALGSRASVRERVHRQRCCGALLRPRRSARASVGSTGSSRPSTSRVTPEGGGGCSHRHRSLCFRDSIQLVVSWLDKGPNSGAGQRSGCRRRGAFPGRVFLDGVIMSALHNLSPITFPYDLPGTPLPPRSSPDCVLQAAVRGSTIQSRLLNSRSAPALVNKSFALSM